MKKLILASQSPRRKELLEKAGFQFQVIPVKISETLDKNLNLDAQLMDLAKRKALALVEEGKRLKGQDFLLLSADTVVILGSRVIGKPENSKEAEQILAELSGQTHQVKTAVCLYDLDQDLCVTAIDTSRVSFHELSLSAIRQYVATGEPMDKAGAYGIQGEGSKFIREVIGSFDNVMGLPIDLVERLIRENGWIISRRKP